MVSRLFLTAILAAGFVSAQERGMGGEEGMGGMPGGGGGRQGGGMGGDMPQIRRQSKQDQLLDKLKLNKDQKEEATKLLAAAMEKAAPARELLAKGRVVVANAITSKASDDDVKKLADAYTNASASMLAIQADTFGKLYALLKPNQQAKAAQTFELLAGILEAGGGGMGGPGRSRGQGRGEGRQ